MHAKAIQSAVIFISALANLDSSPCGKETVVQPLSIETESYTGSFTIHGFFEWRDTRSSPDEIPKKYLSKNYSGELEQCVIADCSAVFGPCKYGEYGGIKTRYSGSEILSAKNGDTISLGTVERYNNVARINGTPCGGDYPLRSTFDVLSAPRGCIPAISTIIDPTTRVTVNAPGTHMSTGTCLPSGWYLSESAGGSVSETFGDINNPTRVAAASDSTVTTGNLDFAYADSWSIRGAWKPGGTDRVSVSGQTCRFRGAFSSVCDGSDGYVLRITYERERFTGSFPGNDSNVILQNPIY